MNTKKRQIGKWVCKLIKYLKHKYALSQDGAKDMVKAFVSCTLSYIVLMLPVSLLYFLVKDFLSNTQMTGERILLYVVGIVVCAILIMLTTYIQYNKTFFATYEESGVRRITLAEKLRKLPLSYFGKKDLADLTSTIMSDCATLETASSHWIPELVGSMASTLIIAISLFFFDWRMALASLWVLPVSFGIVLTSSKFINRKQEKQKNAKLDMADGIQECLESVRDLKANNWEDEYMKGLDTKIKEVEKRTIITELSNAVFNGSARMLLKLGIATTSLVGGVLLKDGKIDVLTFFMFLLVVSRIYDPMNATLDNLSGIVSLNIPCERMNEILDYKVQTGAEKLTNKGYDMVFDNVKFSYDTSDKVIDGASFIAKQGEVTALIGESGGGKTTISRLATRFWDIDSGKISVGGMDISKIEPETLMSLYSIVFQDVTLFNNSILENIRLGKSSATDKEVIEAGKLAHCDEFAMRMPNGWNTAIGENGCELSGGERQRISIARAFLKDAPIILLDEATASLDVENETMIQEALSKLIKNKTVMIIAHRMRTVANADKIVVLSGGKVAEEGTPKKLISDNDIFKHMTDLQAKSAEWKM